MVKEAPISVIIPFFNAAAFIKRALDSISNQTLMPKEVIIVDDGSNDHFKPAGQSHQFNLKVIRHKLNHGVSAARNTGIKHATNSTLAFLDADDLWRANHLENLWSAKVSNPSTLYLSKLMRVNGPLEGAACAEKVYHFGAALLSKEIFNEVGLLDENLRYSEDVEWFSRARLSFPTDFLSEATYVYLINENSLTANTKANELGLLQALRIKMKRARQENESGKD